MLVPKEGILLRRFWKLIGGLLKCRRMFELL